MNSTLQPNSVPTASVSRAASAALIEAVRLSAADMGFEVAVAVTDAAGNLTAFERTDRAPFLTVEVAINKAWTAAAYGIPTHTWNDYLADPKVAPLGSVARLMAVGGGCPIKEDGKVIGGIGVSGGTYVQDQAAAEEALRMLGFE